MDEQPDTNMQMNTTDEKRYALTDLTEEEAIILRTLVNLNERGIEQRLQGDRAYWDKRLSDEEAVETAQELVAEVIDAVDENRENP